MRGQTRRVENRNALSGKQSNMRAASDSHPVTAGTVYQICARIKGRLISAGPLQRVRVVGCLLTPLLLLGGCSSGSRDVGISEVEERIADLAVSRGTQVDDLTTLCMKAQGFSDFVVQPSGGWQEPPLTGPDGEEVEGYERAELHGFGIASGYLYIYEHPDAPGSLTGKDGTDVVEEDEDLLMALWSIASMGDEYIEGGCYAWANREWETQNPDWAAGQAFATELASYIEEAEDDPRLIELDSALSLCMREEGYSIQRASDLSKLVRQQIEDIPPGIEEPDYVAELERIREYEIGLATAAWRCSQTVDTPTRGEVYDDVHEEYRQRFLDDHPELLEPFK